MARRRSRRRRSAGPRRRQGCAGAGALARRRWAVGVVARGALQARGHGAGGAGHWGVAGLARAPDMRLRHGRGHAHNMAAAACDTARARDQGPACAHRLGQVFAQSTWLSFDSGFGPGSTRYYS